MKFIKIIGLVAFQFVAKSFEGEGKRKTFKGIEVRHNGQEHFIFYPNPGGMEVKVLEEQWIVEESHGITVWNDEEFKQAFHVLEGYERVLTAIVDKKKQAPAPKKIAPVKKIEPAEKEKAPPIIEPELPKEIIEPADPDAAKTDINQAG